MVGGLQQQILEKDRVKVNWLLIDSCGAIVGQRRVRARHIRDGIAVGTPGRLCPEDTACIGMRGIGIPSGDDQGENLFGSLQGTPVARRQILLNCGLSLWRNGCFLY